MDSKRRKLSDGNSEQIAKPNSQTANANDKNGDIRNVDLALPLLFTSSGEIPIEDAWSCIYKALVNSSSKLSSSIRVCVVDPDDTKIAKLRNIFLADHDHEHLEICFVVGNIAQLATTRHIHAHVLVNETTWRLKPGATAISKAIESAAGSELMKLTKAKYPHPAKIGKVYPITLDKSSPLRENEGVALVVHTPMPNMNRNRPDAHDQTSALEKLQQVIRSLVDIASDPDTSVEQSIMELGLHSATDPNDSKRDPRNTTSQPERSLFDVLMSSARNPQAVDEMKAKLTPAQAAAANWYEALWKYCETPESFPKTEVYDYDAESVIIYDTYPKARKHFLVMPRRKIDTIAELKKDDIPLVQMLARKGEALIKSFEGSGLTFRMGFHALASMKQLHMHVISQDFDSPRLKNKKHWNSFTTEFFREPSIIIRKLEETGTVYFQKEKYEMILKKPLQCHRCKEHFATMPKLKAHIVTCL